MELCYKDNVTNASEDLINLRKVAINKLNNKITPSKKELDALINFENEYRICNSCKKSIKEGAFISKATINYNLWKEVM